MDSVVQRDFVISVGLIYHKVLKGTVPLRTGTYYLNEDEETLV